MRNVFYISLLLCLIGLTNSIYYGVEHHASHIYTGDISAADHTPLGDHESAIYASSNPFLFIAEKSGHTGSEIEPRPSTSSNLSSKQELEMPQTLYLRQAEYISVSQSVRTLIYPFHTFL